MILPFFIGILSGLFGGITGGVHHDPADGAEDGRQSDRSAPDRPVLTIRSLHLYLKSLMPAWTECAFLAMRASSPYS
jgi:hypothetical protein